MPLAGAGGSWGSNRVVCLGIANLWLAAYLLAAMWHSGGAGLPLDDAWIHARLAHHLAAGSGLVLNTGERASATTSPLWSAVLALPAPIGFLRMARSTHVPWLLFPLQPIATAILAPYGGPEFQEQRYIAHLVVLVVLAGVIGMAATPAWKGRRRRAAALLALGLLSGGGAWHGLRRYAMEVGNIEDMQVRAGRWLSDRPGGPGLIATNDIGAIGFMTGAPILDTTGLATPAVIPYLRRPPAPGTTSAGWNWANEAGLLEYLEQRRPRYVAIFPAWYPSRFFQEALGEVVLRIDLSDNRICGDSTLLIYRPDW